MTERDEPRRHWYPYEVPTGCCFSPPEGELVTYFLTNKIAGAGRLVPCDPLAFIIPTVDLYGPASDPWRLCEELAFPYAASPTEFYCFTTRKKRHEGKGDSCDRVAGMGTWSATGRNVKVWNRGVVVGWRSLFSFKVVPPGTAAGTVVSKNDMVTTHWVMYEYRLESTEFQSTVVCKIRNQKKEDQMEKGTWVTPWWEELTLHRPIIDRNFLDCLQQ